MTLDELKAKEELKKKLRDAGYEYQPDQRTNPQTANQTSSTITVSISE